MHEENIFPQHPAEFRTLELSYFFPFWPYVKCEMEGEEEEDKEEEESNDLKEKNFHHRVPFHSLPPRTQTVWGGREWKGTRW